MSLPDAALRSAPTPLLVLDADDRVRNANDALAAACGVDAAGLVGRAVAELPQFGPLGPVADMARETGVPCEAPAGTCLAGGTAIPLGEGAVLFTFGTPATPGDLRASDVLASISDAFFSLDRDWRFTYVNAQAEPLLEREAADLIGRNVWEEFPAAVDSPFWDAYRQAAATGVMAEFDAFFEPLGRHFAVRAYPFAGGLSVFFADVTARKLADERLRASNERYRVLVDSIDDGFCIIDVLYDADGRPVDYAFLETNPAFESQTGFGADGRTMREIAPDMEQRWFDVYGGVVASGRPVRFEDHADALGRWYSVYATRLGGAGSTRVAVLFSDITARKQAEADLRASEAQARLALDAARLGLWTWDPATDAGTQDARSQEILSIGPGDLLTMAEAFARVIHPDDLAAVQAAVAAAADPAGAGRMAVGFRTQDDPPRWIHATAQTTFEDGRPTAMVGTLGDVTDERRLLAERDAALDRLRQSEERHRIALEGGGMGTWEWDVVADRLASDARAHGLWGMGPGTVESVADFYSRLVHPDDLPALQAEVERTLAGEDDYAAEFRIVRPDGHVRWTANRGRVIRDASGAPVRMFGLSFDVTERREAEEALLRKNAEMEQFAYTISHDLKSPLVTITGFLGLLKGQVQAGHTERALASADRVLGAADRMGRLIDDLLHLSRAGRVTGDPAPVDLTALVGGLAEAFGPRVAAAGGTLTVAPDLGVLLADERRLGEVIENLLANAVTYGLGGGGTQIAVRAEPGRGGGLRLLIEDDGPGVPESYRAKVFELFQRLDGSGDGTGIGLALVARILETTGGSARVESAGGPEERPGARFVLEFPASAVRALPGRAPAR